MTEERPPIPKTKMSKLWLALPILGVAVVALAYVLWPEMDTTLIFNKPTASSPPLPPPPPSFQSNQAPRPEGDLGQLPPPPPPMQVDLSGIEERIARVEKNSADAATVLRLMDRIGQLETALRDLQNRRKADAALVLAVGLLKDAVDRGAPYDIELRALKALAPDDTDIKKVVTDLKSHAAAGIPSRSVLIARFNALEAVAVRADSLPAPGDGVADDWKRKALERLLTLFTLRREDGEIEGASSPAVVARAHAALERGDLADAVHQVDALTGEPAKVMQIWIEDARARLDADREIGDLAADAVAAAGAKL